MITNPTDIRVGYLLMNGDNLIEVREIRRGEIVYDYCKGKDPLTLRFEALRSAFLSVDQLKQIGFFHRGDELERDGVLINTYGRESTSMLDSFVVSSIFPMKDGRLVTIPHEFYAIHQLQDYYQILNLKTPDFLKLLKTK
ncbi:hypothetical protein QEG73_19595 [Chitinophagaceae bacterium 26-R-25]|nr:hypothetical protein [Chitinophagaceae bacterium 26-R-25]